MHKRWLDPFPLIPGLGLLLVSGSCFVTSSERLVLQCERRRDSCTITASRLVGSVTRPSVTGQLAFAASSLESAQYAPPRPGRRLRARMFSTGEIVLKTTQGVYSFRPYLLAIMDRSRHESQQINAFVRDHHQGELRIVHDTRLSYGLLLSVPFLLGAALVARWIRYAVTA
jgi:hypothetical protein